MKMAAIQCNGDNLMYIRNPSEKIICNSLYTLTDSRIMNSFILTDNIIKFIENNDIYLCVKWLNSEKLSYNFYMNAIKNGYSLENVPSIYKTNDLLKEALKNNINNLKYIENQSNELILFAYNNAKYGNFKSKDFIKNPTKELLDKIDIILKDIIKIKYPNKN